MNAGAENRRNAATTHLNSTVHRPAGLHGRLIVLTLALFSAFADGRIVLAQGEALARAKELYASAAYDDALAVLRQMEDEPAAADAKAIAQYRAFCLIALQRADEARREIEGIVREDPQFRLSGELTSPRIQTAFTAVRREVLPKVVLERYAAAKAALDRKDPAAAAQFEAIVKLLDDPDSRGGAVADDMRTIVSAFHDLAVAQQPPAPRSSSIARGDKGSAAPDLAPAGQAAPKVDAIYSAADPDVTAPAAHSLPVPHWTPLRTAGRQEAVLEIVINQRGAVESAVIQGTLDPAYRRLLLRAAEGWKFTPALKAGAPVRYRKMIELHLVPSTR